ncbi:transcriptional regulator [Ktedonobacteria bacterium brp13]|nr:transcriptional regulator [Ktedonobacteria bacterium brp13]
MQKTERLVAITLLLQVRGKMTAQRLSEILNVSKRTIYRDIITLSLAHVPVSMEYGPGGGYYLPDDYRLESAIFTREEAISLILSTDASGNSNLFGGDTDLQRALIKLEAVLPAAYLAEVEVAREHILFDTSAWRGHISMSTHLETIRIAVLRAFQLDILYPGTLCTNHVATQPLRVRIEPLGMVFKGLNRRHLRTGRWYLVAFCLRCQQIHPFRMNTIEQVCLRAEQITPRPDFDLHSYWQEAKQRLETQLIPILLTLRVSPAIRFGLSGDVTILHEERDGGALVNVLVESLEEAVSYTLSLGPGAVILDPPRARTAVAAAAHAIAEIYSTIQY